MSQRVSRQPGWLAALAIFALLIAGVATAAPATVSDRHTRASLVAATDGWTVGRPVTLGLRFELSPGWHTYWSNPGDAGLSPNVTVSVDGGPSTPASLRFPAPKRLPTGSLMGYGYENDVLLPFEVTPPQTRQPLQVAVHADWLVCATVCVPESADLTLALPPTATPAPSSNAPLFTRAEQTMPRPSPFPVTISPAGLLRASGRGIGRQSIVAAWFIPAMPGLIDQDAPQKLTVTEGALTLALHPLPDFVHQASLPGILALTDASGVETDLTANPSRETIVPPAAPDHDLAQLLFLALAGGLVLNLMPCVFPILAMKAMALGRHGPDQRSRLRISAALYTAGILVTFAVFGGATLALRSAGVQAGWGFQFQSPCFVAGTAWLLFAVGLNLAGLFEIGTGIMGAGQTLATRKGVVGDLLTGVLAVLVATPCTAPFMGAAVAAALSGPPAAGLAIFLVLGLGLAAPSLFLGFVPGAARLLPRPGAWMLVIRQLLAFPMFAAVVWLTWVLSEETGPSGVLAGLSGLFLTGLGGWLHGLGQRNTYAMNTRRGLDLAAVAILLAALSILPGLRANGAHAQTASFDGAEPFTPARLTSLRQEGHAVFVDMSAAWCVTCLVNERLALAPSAVRIAFASSKVTLLQGDWTSRDGSVTEFLHQFGREGVPLYVFFPAHDGPPRVLPQVLTPGLVVQTVRDRA